MNKKLILKSPRFVPFGANLTQFGADSDILIYDPCLEVRLQWIDRSI